MKFKLIFLFIIFFSFINISFAGENAELLDTSVKGDTIIPSANFNLDITYQDRNGGIDETSDNFKLYKDSTDISSTYVDYANKNIGQNHAFFPIRKLPAGKYRFSFSIKNINGKGFGTNTYFFVDELEMHVRSDIIDIGELEKDQIKDASQKIIVKTVGTPYTLKMKNPEGLDNFSYKIEPYNGTKGWGTSTGGTLQKINNPEILGTKNKRISSDGTKFQDDYIFKIGAKYTDSQKAAGIYTGTLDFDINLNYCTEYKSDNFTCKDEPKKIKETSGVKKWEDGTYSKTCLDYQSTKNDNYSYLGDIGDGFYMIQPDTSKPAFKVYCDMTTNGGGWTQYVNIKGNYGFEDAKSCWLGTNISNSKLECFNPNRYGIDVESLYNNDWSGKYFYNLSSVGADTTYKNPYSGRKCLGHKEFMTIMKNSTYPDPNANGASFVRFGRSYCGFAREVGGRSPTHFMNYDTISNGSFGQNTGATRETFARETKLYFRELGNAKNIVAYSDGRRFSDGSYAKSCKDYKNPVYPYLYAGNIGNGYYYIDVDGTGPKNAFKVYCDMTIKGGGWTRIRHWNNSGTDTKISSDFPGGNEVIITYKRKNSSTNKYAIKIKQFKTKQCGNEHITIADFVNHIITGSWGTCIRAATIGDYNDIITEKIIEGSYINDPCVTGTLHKTSARNTAWDSSSIRFRVSDKVVIMGPKGDGSYRCDGSYQSGKAQSEVETWVR